MKKTFSKIVLTANFFAVIALLISYSAVFIPPDKFWEPSFFGLAYPFIFIANILFAIYWIIIKLKYSFLSIIVILIGLGFLTRYVQIGGKNLETGGIKVISYNVRNFGGYDESNPRENANKIIEFLNKQEPNIICLQETRVRRSSIFNLQNVLQNLPTINHYQYASAFNIFGLVTMTTFPIVNMNEIRFKDSGNMAIFTDILIGKDTIRVFNVHLQSYGFKPDKYSIVESPFLNEKKDLKEVHDMAGILKRGFQQRAIQVRQVKEYIGKSPYPVIVCGDFNDTPMSYAYQKLRGDLTDSFISSGKGIDRTYVGKLPSFRIDNIFYSDKFESYNFKAYDFKMSDHLPISCDLVLKD